MILMGLGNHAHPGPCRFTFPLVYHHHQSSHTLSRLDHLRLVTSIRVYIVLLTKDISMFINFKIKVKALVAHCAEKSSVY